MKHRGTITGSRSARGGGYVYGGKVGRYEDFDRPLPGLSDDETEQQARDERAVLPLRRARQGQVALVAQLASRLNRTEAGELIRRLQRQLEAK